MATRTVAFPNSRAREHGKAILERLDTFEKSLGDVCQQLNVYILKTSKVRDQGDLLANSLIKFAESESVSRTLKLALTAFGESVAAVQDHRDVQVTSLESKVLNELCAVGDNCANAKENAKKLGSAKDTAKETVQRHRNLSSGNTEMSPARVAAIQVERFEKKKVMDIKSKLGDLIKIELQFHAKAIETMTRAYENILSIDEKLDMENFMATFGLNDQRAANQGNPGPAGQVNSLRRFSSTPEIPTSVKKRPKEIELASEEESDTGSIDSRENAVTQSPKSSEV